MGRGIMERTARKDVSKRRRVRNCSHSITDLTSLTDDMLTEVFLRLPDGRSLLLSATVCKRWCSLILTPERSCPQRQFFEFHHLYRADHAFSILFKLFPARTKPYCHLWANACRPYSLSFIHNSGRLGIMASSGDLLLLSDGCRQSFICNSLTKLWFPLPKMVSNCDRCSGFALINRYNDLHHLGRQLGRYRVVVLKLTLYAKTGFYHCVLTLFDSHVGTWTTGSASIPVQFTSEMFASFGIDLEILNPGDGSLYWLDGSRSEYASLVSLDAFSLKLRLIPLPQGVKRKERVNSGLVRGRVRLSRSTAEGDELRLRVWELDCRDDSWSSVHDVKILQNIPTKLCFVVGFVPNDGDSVLLVLGSRGIFRYEIGKDKGVKICEFPKEKEVGRDLKLQTLVHPFWPTALP